MVESNCEVMLIGSLVVDPFQIDRVSSMIEGRDFAWPEIGEVYDRLVSLHREGVPINDPTIVLQRLTQEKFIGREGSRGIRPEQLLHAIQNGIPANVHFYATTIQRDAARRKLNRLTREVDAKIAEQGADPNEVVEWLQQRAKSIRAGYGDSPITYGEAINNERDAIAREEESRASRPATVRTIMSGMPTLDSYVRLSTGELSVIAGRPGSGKTAFVGQIIENIAMRGHAGLFLSMEMRSRDIINRLIVSKTDIPIDRVKSINYSPEDKAKIQSLYDGMKNLKLWLWDRQGLNIRDVKSIAHQWKSAHDISLLAIDYLSLLSVSKADFGRPRHEVVAEWVRELRMLACELDIHVMLLSQLTRDADLHSPTMSHLRETGTLEQEAQLIILIDTSKGKNEKPEAAGSVVSRKFIIAKNRNGGTGTINFQWDGAKTRFLEY